MIKKALIFDLDDTIYPTRSVADEMYKDLYDLLKKHVPEDIFQRLREDLLTTPFQNVADRYALDKNLRDEGMKICLEMEYNGSITAFDDYHQAIDNTTLKFLVTAGYTKPQKSKIKQLGIESDFKEVIIADPYNSDLTKKDVFKLIMDKYQYQPFDILVIGDNPESEIAAAKDLGIETYLYDYEGKFSPALADYYGTHYGNLKEMLDKGADNK